MDISKAGISNYISDIKLKLIITCNNLIEVFIIHLLLIVYTELEAVYIFLMCIASFETKYYKLTFVFSKNAKLGYIFIFLMISLYLPMLTNAKPDCCPINATETEIYVVKYS